MAALRILGVTAGALIALAGCSTISKVGSVVPFGHHKSKAQEIEGNRIPVLALNNGLKVSPTLKGQGFYLPPPTPIADWPTPGGTLTQSVENVAAAPAFVVAWRRSIGVGYSRLHYVTAPPIAANGRLFVMDGDGDVSALDERTGAQFWRTSIKPRTKRNHTAFGGGLAYDDGKVYVSSGFRELVEIDAATGRLLWRVDTDAPLHAAPTVAGGRVFVVDVNDQLLAFDATTGAPDWSYQALTEPARILAASSPAVLNDTVIASFASGELIALRTTNGNPLWDASLSQANQTNALSEIRDIAGRPVIYKDDVYAVSHSNVLAATDLRTGSVRWSLPVSAITTPWPAGDVVFVVDQTGQVICAAREAGDVYWITDLNAPVGKKHKRDKHPAYWSSPILASGRLITVSSKGDAVALNPQTGAVEARLKLGADALIGPMAAGNMIYVATETGQLIAIR